MDLELTWHRERVGLTQEQAAAEVDVSRVLLAYYESGQRPVPLRVAVKLARLYAVSLDRLVYGSSRAEPAAPVELLFRGESSLDRLRPALNKLQGWIQFLADISEDVGVDPAVARVSLFQAKGSRFGQAEVARRAREVREHFGLGGGPITDVLSVADEVALVFRVPLGRIEDENPSGFFFNDNRAGLCIVVNTSTRPERQVFSVAHELAHALFHAADLRAHVSRPSERNGLERFANDFAGEFLVPGDSLRRAVEQSGRRGQIEDPATIIRLQRRFNVSFQAMLVRMRQERLISQNIYEHLWELSPGPLARSLGLSQPSIGDAVDGPFATFPPVMIDTLLLAIRDGKLSEHGAAQALDVDVEDLEVLLDPRDTFGDETAPDRDDYELALGLS